MWHTPGMISRRYSSALAASLPELWLRLARSLMWITLVAGLTLTGVAMSTVWQLGPPDLPLLAVALGGLTALGLAGLHRHPGVAQALWLAGVSAIVAVAGHLLGVPEVTLAYVPLMFAAAALGGPVVGVLAVMAAAAGMGWLGTSGYISGLGNNWTWAVTIAGGLGVGFASTANWVLLEVTEWSLAAFVHMQGEIEQRQAERLEYEQVKEDLTLANREMARLSDRLRALSQAAEEARRAKAEFVANVSHELRTPLNMIIGFTDLILRSSELYGARLPPALLGDIGAIERNSEHLARLIDDVLDLSQAEAGRSTLSREWTVLPELIETAMEAVRVLYDSKGLYLETNLEPDLPTVWCDCTRVRQVLINLLSNAGRFTERGGVQVVARRAANHIEVGVTDTGPGISPEDQARLFEPFQQLDASIRRRHGGSGLGLSISKRFVEMHGGKMWLDSLVGFGSTFFFSLPIETPSAGLPAPGERHFSPYQDHDYRIRTRTSRAEAPHPAPRYVVVERGGTVTRLLGRQVQDAEVVTVSELAEAFAELSRSPANVLIVNRPDTYDTANLLEGLRELPEGVPAAACWLPGLEGAAQRLGVMRYLVKPVTRKVLLDALSELCPGAKSVLIVDDNAEALQLFSRMLGAPERRMRVWQARNGQQALAALRERRPDVMVLDLVMPGVDGFAVLREKESAPDLRDIPVIVVSSLDPAGEPIVSDLLTLTRKGGLSAGELLRCITAAATALGSPTDGQALPESHPG